MLDLAAGSIRRADGGVFLRDAGRVKGGLAVGLSMAYEGCGEPTNSHAGGN